MAWEIKPARDAFPSFAAEWDRLNREIYRGHPMFDSRFVEPLLECFAKGDEQLCIHRSTTEADGALILRPTGLGRWTLFLPAQAQAGMVLLRDARLMETLLASLPGFAWSIELLALDPRYSPDWTHLRLPRAVQPHTLTMAVEVTDGDFDAYWRARPKKLVANLSRYRRRTEGQYGAPSSVTIDNPQEMTAAVARYGEMEMAGWKRKAGTAVSIANAQGRFYAKTLRDFAATGQAIVLELHVGGKLAASRLIVRHERSWIMLKTSYDESLAAIAPGWQLLHQALKQAFLELRPGSVEFYTNATRDQSDWASSLRYICHHQLYRGQLSAAIHGLAQMLHTSISGRMAAKGGEAEKEFDPTSIERYASAQEFTPDTVRLFDESSRQNIEFSLGWFDNLQRTVFAADPGVRYYVKELAQTPTAALPLRLARNGPIRRIETLGNFYTSLYAPILGPASTSLDLLPLLVAANQDHHGAHLIQFAPLDPDSPTYEMLLTALRSSGWIPFRYFCFGNWYLKVDKPWPEYLKEREGKLRSTIKRMSKRFAAEGGTLEIVTDPAPLEPTIREFIDIYAASWKKPEPYPDFIPGLIRCLAQRGALRLGIARLAGRAIAAQIWIVHHGKASIFKLAYDDSFAAFSPGTLLTAHLMERAIEQDRVTEVDYLIGDDPYKQSWMSHRRERRGIVAYNPRTLIGLALLIRGAAGHVLRKLLILQSSWLRRACMAPTNFARRMLKAPGSSQVKGAITSDNITWSLFSSADFATIAPRWQALCDATIRTPLLSADFVGTALRHFGRGDELICLAEGPTGPVAGAILQRKNWLVWQTFQPSQMPLGPWLQQPGADLVQVAQSLLRRLPFPAMVIAATQLDPDFYGRPECRGVMTVDSITTGRTSLAPDIAQFMETENVKGNPKLLSSLMRRMRNAERDHGKPTLTVEKNPEAAKEYVNAYAAMESLSWKGLAGTALAPDDAQANFYSELMQRFAALGAARMYTLKFGDTSVARQIAVAGAGVMILLKTTFDSEFRSLGPGVMQMYRVIRDVYERDPAIKVIELYGPFNESQKLWVSGTRVIYHANVYRYHFLASVHRRLTEARRRRPATLEAAAGSPE